MNYNESIRSEVVQDTVSGQASVLSEMVASAIQPILDRHGIGFGSFDLLAAVHAADGRLAQAAIARRMGISAASLTEAVKGAAKRGLIEQTSKKGDSRAKVLALTKKGQGVLSECFLQLEATERQMCEGIDPKSIEIAIQVLRQCVSNLALYS